MTKSKKDNLFITFLQGFVIGFGIIFPISSSVLAMTMGIYERLLKVINNLFTSFKKEKGFIISFALGVISSAIVCCLVLNITLKKFPVATLLFFVGLIVGGIQMIVKKTEKKITFANILFSIVGAAILISISFLGSGQDAIIVTDLMGYLKLFGVGIIAAGTMIIPGVSGSAILIILGYYAPLLAVISNTMHFKNLNTNIFIVLVFMIGMLIGIFGMSKLMEYLLDKHKIKTYFAIVGFVFASIINIIILIFGYKFKLLEFIIGMVLFLIGYLLSAKYLKGE